MVDESHIEAQAGAPSRRVRNAVVFAVIAAVWIVLDFAVKRFFDGTFSTGGVIAGPFAGLFQFRLVHNTGAAWGMFGDSTFALGVLSLVVCALLLVYLFVLSPHATVVQTMGLALVFAGGIGNAIDRFAQGYVVDFIEFSFIDFPVFNIADIGVTCGFVIFLFALVLQWRREDARSEAIER